MTGWARAWQAAPLLWALLACDEACDGSDPGDTSLTLAHRAALPRFEPLQMPSPGAAAAAGEAQVPPLLVDAADQNNGWLEGHLAMLELMADRAPAQQDLARRLTTWGPFGDESTPLLDDELVLRARSYTPVTDADGGPALADGGSTPRDGGQPDAARPAPGDDFEVVYTLSRRLDGDDRSEQVVLWGATRWPRGGPAEGLLTWDFEASRRWDAERNPLQQRLERGRVALAYAEVATTAASGPRRHLVAVQWRDFVPRSADDGVAPLDVDQRWSRQGPDAVDLVALAGPAQIDRDDTSAVEQVQVEAAFARSGAGRARLVGRGGDIPAGFRVDGEECWGDRGEILLASGTLVHEPGYLPPSPARETEGSAGACRVELPGVLVDVDALPAAVAEWLHRGADEGARALAPLDGP